MRNFRWHCYITGAILILLGILTFMRPVEALLSVGFFIGCGLVASGLNYFAGFYFFSLARQTGLTRQTGLKRFIVFGIFDLLMGLVMIIQPGLSAFFIPYVIALWLLSTGLSRTCAAFWLGGAEIKGWWLMLINGVALIISALLVAASPLISAVSVMIILACVLILAGVLVIFESRIEQAF